MGDQKRFLTVREVAAMTDTPVRTVQRWCKTGAIPAVLSPTGHDYKVPVETLRDRADLAGYATSREAELDGY